MADNSKKISELPTASNAALTDRILILRSPAANASVRTISANDFISSFQIPILSVIPNTTVTSNSITVSSNGNSNVAFFSYTIDSGKTGCCDITVHARDVTTDSTSAASILLVANTSFVQKQETQVTVGTPSIQFDVDPTLSSNVITLYFKRSAEATSNVLLRFSATIY